MEMLKAISFGKRSVLLALCLLIPVTCAATEVIIIAYQDRIFLAADSLRVEANGVPVPRAVCKVHSAGRVWWSAEGITADDQTGFSVSKFFDADTDVLTTEQVLDSIGPRIKVPLQKEVLKLRREHPDQYEKIMSQGAMILTLFAGRVSARGPQASMKAFKVVENQIVPQPTTNIATDPRIHLMMSKNPDVDRYIASNPDIWNDSPENFVGRLMNVAIAADPKSVGPPVTIVLVTKDSAKWLRQNSCESMAP
jgi:hypothetical protein